MDRSRSNLLGYFAAFVAGVALALVGMMLAGSGGRSSMLPSGEAAARSPAVTAEDAPPAEVARLGDRVERLEKENDQLRGRLAARPAAGRGADAAEPAVTAPQAAAPPPTPAEELAALVKALADKNNGAIWHHAIRFQELLKSSPALAIAAILDALAANPSEELLKTLGNMLANKDFALTPEDGQALRDLLLQAALSSEEPAAAAEALRTLDRFLRNHPDEAGALSERQILKLTEVVIAGGDLSLRSQAVAFLGTHASGNAAYGQALHAVISGDPDRQMRVKAISALRGQPGANPDGTILELLRQETEPVVLWEAARVANFLTMPKSSMDSFKGAYRDLMGREVDDRARGQAAQSLALLAVLDQDVTVAEDLRRLAAASSDPALAEFARLAATQLEDGSATIVSIAQAWQRWHQGLDTAEFP